MPIRNRKELLEVGTPDSRPRELVLEALEAALREADPALAIRRKSRLSGSRFEVDGLVFDLDSFSRILVVGGGKASGTMAEALNEILRGRITGGIVNIPDYLDLIHQTGRIEVHRASHPIPNANGVRGVKKMLKLVGDVSGEDLVICLFSGGGSSLMPLPAEDLSLDDKKRVTGVLLKSGATINELNTVRKHLSALKGGRLAQRLYPATVLALIVSDVVGDILDTVASGPTTPDNTTFHDAIAVLKKYGLWDTAPSNVRQILSRGAVGEIGETPKHGDKVFQKVHNIVVASNRLACEAALTRLREHGLNTMVLTTHLQGEAAQAGIFLASIAHEIYTHNSPLARPAAIVVGGETTVTVHGAGRGGRNQELALSAAEVLTCLDGVAFASMGTDGVDGPTDAAGAIVDSQTARRALSLDLHPSEYLQRNDSYTLFARLGDLILTGPTGTNINDIAVLVVT